MVTAHIAVGLDGSPASRHALRWAIREAVRRNAVVLVVTACPYAGRPTCDDPVPTALVGAYRMQRQAIAAEQAAVPGAGRLVIGREVIVAEPVVALCHAAARADLLVLGSDESSGLPETSIPGRVAQRLAGWRLHGRSCPLLVIPTPADAAAADRPAEGTPHRTPATATAPRPPATVAAA